MKNYIRFLKLLIPHSGTFLAAVVCMILSSILEASPLGLIIPLVDVIISGKKVVIPASVNVPAFVTDLVAKVNALPKLQLLNIMVLAMVVFFLLKAVFEFLKDYLMSDVSQKVIRDLKDTIYKKLIALSMDFYSKNPTGQLMSRITNDTAVIRDAIGSAVADVFYQPIKVIVYVIALVSVKVFFGISWELIVVSLILFPMILLPVMRIGKRLREISRRSQEKIADISNMLLETISGIKVVKSFCMGEYEKDRFRKQNQAFYKLNMKSVKRMKIVGPLTESMGVVCVTTILWLAGKSIVTGDLSAGAFAAFLAAVLSLMKPVKKLSSVYGINQQALAATDRVFEILDTPVTIKERPGPVKFGAFEKDIVLEDVWFKYSAADESEVLKGVTLKVRKGEIVALVGPSGGGKTTLVNLIPRFYDPERGSVRIDGIDIREMSLTSLREKIGLVTQETVLFNDTIRANITYGHTEADEEQLEKVARAANAHNFIKDFPSGYDTMIGERGANISGGQRQRLSIARAIYKNPPILILDEATSQLDTESEKLVQDAINNLMKGRTVIVIAHRLSTVTHADKIVVIEDGRISDTGSHEELLKRSALYKKLYEMQFEDRREQKT